MSCNFEVAGSAEILGMYVADRLADLIEVIGDRNLSEKTVKEIMKKFGDVIKAVDSVCDVVAVDPVCDEDDQVEETASAPSPAETKSVVTPKPASPKAAKNKRVCCGHMIKKRVGEFAGQKVQCETKVVEGTDRCKKHTKSVSETKPAATPKQASQRTESSSAAAASSSSSSLSPELDERNVQSVIFITEDGHYADEMKENSVVWCGQNKGGDDYMCVVGTNIFFRKKEGMPFVYKGVVSSKTLLSIGSHQDGIPSKYNLTFDNSNPLCGLPADDCEYKGVGKWHKAACDFLNISPRPKITTFVRGIYTNEN